MSQAPLMPKATAVWLIENTRLTFKQIADFCHLHLLEVQALANRESGPEVVGQSPITSGQLTIMEIKRCEEDPNSRLVLVPPMTADSILGKKSGKYTPVAKRQDRPDAIAWLIKFHPELNDNQIKKLVATTKPTITAVRTKSHWNSDNIKPRNPVHLGLCSQEELDEAIQESHPKE